MPELIARACVQVLPVTGAGLSFDGNPRIPLGASDPVAARAESLETTLGEGPCLTARAHPEPFRTSGESMGKRWPLFALELFRHTPYRAVASLPLTWHDGRRFGALNLYAGDENVFTAALLHQINVQLTEPVRVMLFQDPRTSCQHTYASPGWLTNDVVITRMNVSVAIGQLMEAAILTDEEALATLRGYAFTHNTTIDELARQLTTNQIDPDTVLG